MLLYGDVVADSIDKEIIKKIKSMQISPKLALVAIGNSSSNAMYYRMIKSKFEKLGMSTELYAFGDYADIDDISQTISNLNNNFNINGIILIEPIAKQFEAHKIRNLITPGKDVEGVTTYSSGMLYSNMYNNAMHSCTAEACIHILDYYDIDIAGKNVVVLGRSMIVGKPLTMMLLSKNATVTTCHTHTRDITTYIKEADIVISAIGKAKHVKCFPLYKGQAKKVIIDVGINFDKNNKVCGDIDIDQLDLKQFDVTPVPNGVGKVTVSVIALHVLDSYLSMNNSI